jgi:hypothetical protein
MSKGLRNIPQENRSDVAHRRLKSDDGLGKLGAGDYFERITEKEPKKSDNQQKKQED